MKLIKLTEEHYIVIDHSPPYKGDPVYDLENCVIAESGNEYLGDHCRKITHSTKTLFNYITGEIIDSENLPLQEVKELIRDQSKKEWEVQILDDKLKLRVKEEEVILGGGYTCSVCGMWNRTSALCYHDNLITGNTERSEGYYWVKEKDSSNYQGNFIVAKWNGTIWQICGHLFPMSDFDFEHIGERIKQP